MKSPASILAVGLTALLLACGGADDTAMDEMEGMEDDAGMMADSAGTMDEGMPVEMMPDSAGSPAAPDTTGGMSDGGV